MNESTNAIQNARADLYLVGAGVLFPAQLTLQTIDILAACHRICTNLPEARIQSLPTEIREKCICLWPLYKDNRKRIDNYRDVFNAVVDTTENHQPCAWMTPGHPFVFDSVSQELIVKGRELGWTVQVVPAISSLDALLAQVAYDPCYGLTIYDATSLVRDKIPLSPSFATVLFQPSIFGSDLAHLSRDYPGPSLTDLRNHLLEFYPAAHRCAFVYSASCETDCSRIVWEELEKFGTIPYESFRGSTLFIPPVGQTQSSRSIPND